MMTAGMVDQEAFDYRGVMSVFTHFLVQGLSTKDADYTKDDVVTLTELLVFVQDKVSTYVAGLKTTGPEQRRQTPVLGKIGGAGEMIFVLR
jgi:hypothetical protein